MRQKTSASVDEAKHLKVQPRRKSKTKKVMKMVAIVTLNFGICWFPTHLFALLRYLYPTWFNERPASMYNFKTFANTLTYLTPVLNPFLYGFFNENFRTPLIKLLRSDRNRTTGTPNINFIEKRSERSVQ
jgi:hypothetical protein